jgi:hypothetical protein
MSGRLQIRVEYDEDDLFTRKGIMQSQMMRVIFDTWSLASARQTSKYILDGGIEALARNILHRFGHVTEEELRATTTASQRWLVREDLEYLPEVDPRTPAIIRLLEEGGETVYQTTSLSGTASFKLTNADADIEMGARGLKEIGDLGYLKPLSNRVLESRLDRSSELWDSIRPPPLPKPAAQDTDIFEAAIASVANKDSVYLAEVPLVDAGALDSEYVVSVSSEMLVARASINKLYRDQQQHFKGTEDEPEEEPKQRQQEEEKEDVDEIVDRLSKEVRRATIVVVKALKYDAITRIRAARAVARDVLQGASDHLKQTRKKVEDVSTWSLAEMERYIKQETSKDTDQHSPLPTALGKVVVAWSVLCKMPFGACARTNSRINRPMR